MVYVAAEESYELMILVLQNELSPVILPGLSYEQGAFLNILMIPRTSTVLRLPVPRGHRFRQYQHRPLWLGRHVQPGEA